MKTIAKSTLMRKLGRFVKVENMDSRNGCGTAPNQFILTFTRGVVFQSYRSLVAAEIDGVYYFTQYHDYSNTTSRFCKAFCDCNVKERRKGLDEGKFIFVKD